LLFTDEEHMRDRARSVCFTLELFAPGRAGLLSSRPFAKVANYVMIPMLLAFGQGVSAQAQDAQEYDHATGLILDTEDDLKDGPHLFLSAIVAYVGLDPVKDIHWVVTSSIKPMELYADGKIDAFLGFPPEPQHLRAHNIGKVILNSAVDRPWSQYLCCMLAAHRDYVRTYPVATKRALRAIIKAADLCVSAPMRVAQQMVAGDFHRSVRLCAADAQRTSVRKVARVRTRGRSPILFAAAARSGRDQVQPQQNYCGWHRLAFV
jgi:NMT1-like family